MYLLRGMFCLAAICGLGYSRYCNPGCKNDSCNEDGRCSHGCKVGYYEDYCTTCVLGYFKNIALCCPDNCEECLSDTSCSVCKEGWYGQTCNTPCPTNCYTQICNINDGSCCKQGYTGPMCDQCSLGWYNLESQCKPCPKTCEVCSAYRYIKCSVCKDGWYGQMCNTSCPTNCNTQNCHIDNGICCKQGFTGAMCDQCLYGWYKSNYGQCKQCPANCHDCSSELQCFSCSAGYHDITCQSKCSADCRGETHSCDKSTGKCMDGCIDGRWGESCNRRCPSLCTQCTSHNSCNLCEAGYHGNTCQSKCSAGCRGESHACYQSTGNCLHGCNDGYNGSTCSQCIDGRWGKNCRQSCPFHCKTCSSRTSCYSCVTGYYGDACRLQCSAGCKGCDNSTGKCTNGCIDGHWGEYCNSRCPSSCTSCSSNNSCNSCVAGYYGTSCQFNCSRGCERNCHKIYGSCILGCKDGYFDVRCDKECSRNCLNRTCDRSNGTCTHGCIGGYKGHNYAHALKHTQSNNSGTIAGAVAGVCVLIVITVIVFITVQRRAPVKVYFSRTTTTKRKIKCERANLYEQETTIAMDVIEPVYRNMPASGLNSATNADRKSTMSEAEAVPIEHHTPRNHLTLSRISGLDGIAISLEERGECVEDVEETSTGETYNNFEAISKNGIPIDKLTDYVTGKSKQELVREFLSVPKEFLKPYDDSQKPKNITKNRYRGIYPYDVNRVRLHTGNSDYINASYINGFRKEKEYIAALGPIDATTNHFITFWTMVWQEMVGKIVMLTNLVEYTKMKCEQYWPELGSSAQYGDVSVSSMAEEQYAEFTVRIFSVTKNSEKRMLYHFHYTAWPDKGVPDDVTGLIEFRNKVLAIKSSLEGAMIVHCSAGVGRTGTYIALDYLTKEGEEIGSVDILACFASLRDQRVYMIQAKEQYIYLHDAVVHSLTYDSQPIHSENFKDYVKTLDTHTLQTKFKKLQLGMDRKDEAEVIAVNRNKTFKTKNHPQADIPGDRYRPKLHLSETLGDSGYINAVYLDSFRRRNHYVVTQTPLPETTEDFLTLIYQEYVPCIVDMQPNVQTKTSITEYLPVDGQRSKYGSFEIESVKMTSNEQFALSRVTVSRHTYAPSGKEQRTVHHYKYTGWGHRLAVPSSPANFINFVREVEVKSMQEYDMGKILLHCSSGAERSCLFSAVSVMLQKMESEHEVSTVNVIRQIKFRRPTAIPTKEQYLFCHQCVEAFLDTFDTYSNFAARQ